RREELPRHPLAGRLPGHRFRAVLTELGGVLVLRVRPGAGGTVEPAVLVHLEEDAAAPNRSHLAETELERRQHGGHARGLLLRLFDIDHGSTIGPGVVTRCAD